MLPSTIGDLPAAGGVDAGAPEVVDAVVFAAGAGSAAPLLLQAVTATATAPNAVARLTRFDLADFSTEAPGERIDRSN